jgi:Recombinase
MSAKRKRRRERKLLRQHRVEPKRIWASPGEFQEVEAPNRLAYSRKQAAEAVGVSISTVDRRLVPSVNTVKTPWGQRLIPLAELERFLREHLQPPREPGERGTAGRPPSLPRRVVERIRLEYARGRGLADIARALNEDGVPTAHGGRQWWPSTVRAVLVRSSPLPSAEVRNRAA